MLLTLRYRRRRPPGDVDEMYFVEANLVLEEEKILVEA